IVDSGQSVVDGGQRIGSGLADRLAFVDGDGGGRAGRGTGSGGSVGHLHVGGKVSRRARAVRTLDEPVAVVVLIQVGFVVGGDGGTISSLERQAASRDCRRVTIAV